MTMPPQLVAQTEGPNILLDKPILLLGRHQECDIQLGSRKVSRRHCCLAQVNDYLVVRDLGSTNGIRINGVRVLEGSLRAGDELTIGNQRYKVQWNAKLNEPVASLMAAPLPREQPQPPALQRPEQEAQLESGEIPVPLADPESADISTGFAAPALLPQAQPAHFSHAEAPPIIFPDELKLEPLSGERRANPPAAPEQQRDS
jgi:predicted component of type VI protein secretion system